MTRIAIIASAALAGALLAMGASVPLQDVLGGSECVDALPGMPFPSRRSQSAQDLCAARGVNLWHVLIGAVVGVTLACAFTSRRQRRLRAKDFR